MPTVEITAETAPTPRSRGGNIGLKISAAILLALTVLAIVGPMMSPYAPAQTDFDAIGLAPTLQESHWFGTDRLGRDLWVRTWHGARVSLLIGVLATGVSLLIGVLWGAVAGYTGGRTDALMMRFVDVLYSLPYVFFVIVLMVMFGRNFVLLFVAIGAVGWLTMARIVRGQTLAIRNREFIAAAQVMGVSRRNIILHHVLPNVIGPVIVYATLTVPQMILFEGFLSFLGLGVQEPLASLGNLIAAGAAEMETAPWILWVPGAVLVLLLACCNFVGDGLRDQLDART